MVFYFDLSFVEGFEFFLLNLGVETSSFAVWDLKQSHFIQELRGYFLYWKLDELIDVEFVGFENY